MRQRKQEQKGKKPGKKTEPLAEGIVPLNKRGRRDWKSMSDEELVKFARSFMEEKGISGRKELETADSGLYEALRKRGLLEAVGFEEKRRNWASMSDEEIIGYACGLVEEKGLKGRKELRKVDHGLYAVLWKRKLFDEVGVEKQRRDWASMSDDDLVEYAKAALGESEIGRRAELVELDPGLYVILKKRGLLDSIGLNRQYRDWASMSDDEIVDYAKGFISRERITRRLDLAKADSGLYDVLRIRKLLDRIGLQGQRDWASMSDDEIVDYAKGFVDENGIKNRKGLAKADIGLYQILRRRGLLDRLFAPFESEQKREAIQEVVDAMKEFERQDL